MTTEKRAHVRVPARLRVLYEHGGAQVETFSRDISLGGMFLEAPPSLPFGTALTLEVALPALPRPALLPAVVRWVKGDGMGVSFGALRAAETWAINQIVAAQSRT